MSNGTIENYPQFQTGTVALKADGTVWEPPPTPPSTIEGYPPITTNGVAIDPDGVVWLYAPTQPGGIVEVTPPPVPPVNTVPPVIQIVAGNPTPGQTAINSSPGTWVPPQTLGYQRQWRRSGVAIPGATGNSYIIQTGDVGGVLTCGVIAIGDGGESAEAASNGLTVIPLAPPINVSPPTVTFTTGGPTVGNTAVNGSPGTWNPTASSYQRQWQSGGVNIPGATATSYILQASDVGNLVRVGVTGINTDGQATAYSAPVGPVTDVAADEGRMSDNGGPEPEPPPKRTVVKRGGGSRKKR